jgi:myo-inositol-1(or 4)-monophosphatase
LALWDRAAGELVAREAGVLVTGLRGGAPGPAMVLAAPPAVHSHLRELLEEFDADGGP